jgi:adenylate cyclase
VSGVGDTLVPQALHDALGHAGVSDDEVAEALASGSRREIVRQLVSRVLVPGRRDLTLGQAAEMAGIERATALRFWMALGFADPEDDLLFSTYDVASFHAAVAPLEGDVQFGTAIEQSRVIASAMATVAELWTDNLVRSAQEQAASGASGVVIADRIVTDMALERLLPALDYVFRRQLMAALQRRISYEDLAQNPEVVVGFADLTGFTRMSQNLRGAELAELVRRFESVTRDAIAARGGRAVKSIGDEVMFTVSDPIAAVDLAVDLVDAVADDDLLPPMRVGLAWGEVVQQDGDVYGPTVNRASRMVDLARAGAILVDGDLRAQVADVLDDEDDPDGVDAKREWRLRPYGRRRLKDIGVLRMWSVARA